MPDGRRSVLVAAYYFPPWGGGPLLRTLKLVKYLAPLGWNVCVLTAEPRYYEAVSHDPELLREIELNVRVVRTRSLQPAGSFAQGLVAEAVGGPSRGRSLARVAMPIARIVHQLLIPDDKVLWLPHAMRGGLCVVRQWRPDVVYVTTPPHSTSLLGLLLSRAAHAPLVLDIRDDWVGNPLFRRVWRLRGHVEALMERVVVHAAAAILVPTIGSRCALAARYPDIADRIHLVPNGFDEDDIERARQLPSAAARRGDASGQLECVYTGLITGRRNLVPLFQAIQRVNRRTPGAVRMQIAGFLTQDARDAISSLGVSGDVTELGYIPHVQALRCILDSDVAMLVSTEGEGARTAVPSKLYEYAACGKVVLGLVDPGATCELIERNQWGVVCAPDDVDSIERTLLQLIDRKTAGTLALSQQATDQVTSYSRRFLAGVASGILEATIR